MTGIRYQNRGDLVWFYNNSFYLSQTSGIPDETISSFGLAYGYNSGVTSRVLPSTAAEAVIFNRALSNDEIVYYYNNGLGNDIAILDQILGHYKMRQAEELTINGIQDVGIKNDIQDAYHLKINGLPAGTIEEKRDWANANLFVNFL